MTITNSYDKRHAGYWLALVAVGLVFWVLTSTMPYINDDLSYHFKFFPQPVEGKFMLTSPQRIASANDWLESAANHYKAYNGRLADKLSALFNSLPSKQWFNVANALMAMLLCHLTTLLTGRRRWWLPLLLLTYLWVIVPEPGQTVLWVSGSLNYLWAATLSLLVLWLLQRPEKPGRHVALKCVGLFVLGLAAGNMNEGMSAGMSLGLVAWYATHRKQLTAQRAALVAGFVAGTLCLVLSPGTMTRILKGKELHQSVGLASMAMHKMLQAARIWAFHTCLLPMLALAVALWRRGQLRSSLNTLPVWIVAAQALALLPVTMLSLQRMYFGASLLTLLITVTWLCPLLPCSHTGRRVALAAIVLAAAATTGWAGHEVSLGARYYRDTYNKVRQAQPETVIVEPPFTASTRFVPYFPLYKNHTFYLNRELQYLLGKKSVTRLDAADTALLSLDVTRLPQQAVSGDSAFDRAYVARDWVLIATREADIATDQYYSVATLTDEHGKVREEDRSYSRPYLFYVHNQRDNQHYAVLPLSSRCQLLKLRLPVHRNGSDVMITLSFGKRTSPNRNGGA